MRPNREGELQLSLGRLPQSDPPGPFSREEVRTWRKAGGLSLMGVLVWKLVAKGKADNCWNELSLLRKTRYSLLGFVQ